MGDDADADSRCHSSALVDLILADSGGAIKARQAQALGQVGEADAQVRLAHTVCKFTTEWEKASIATHWRWLTQETPPGAGMMAGTYLRREDFPKFQRHTEAMCFWEDANLGIPAQHWHFHPRESIRAFRQCGWLSKDEMLQLFPMTAMRVSNGAWVSEPVKVVPRTVDGYHVDLNKACRRYGIVTPLRMAAFYANTMVETQWFAKLAEDFNPGKLPRYYPWFGRGFIHLTWPDNYIKYWRFVGKGVDEDLAKKLDAARLETDKSKSDAPLVAMESHLPDSMKDWRRYIGDGSNIAISADSAGAYWTWHGFAQSADAQPANRPESKPAKGDGSHTYYSSQGMDRVARIINGGGNGLVARFQAYNACEVVLMDTPTFPGANPPNEPKNYKPRRP